MSDVFQPGRHPDADQLSAFVEQALPAHEREAMLAHLAVCAECRAAVALSLPAEQIATPAEKPARKVWFRGWNLAWPAAAAVAALALVIVYVHHVSVARSGPGRNAEIALAPKPAPIAPQPIPRKQAPESRELRQAPAKKSAGAGFGNVGALDELQRAPGSATAKNRVQSAAGGGGVGGESITSKDVLKQPMTLAEGRGSNAPLAEAKEQSNTLAAPAKPANQPAADAVRNEIQGAPVTAGLGAGANGNSESVARKATPSVRPLPSGLPILSRAEHGRQMLALDTAHALFLSEDAGVHWRAVAVPWKARALMVSLVSSPQTAVAQNGNGFGAGPVAGLGGMGSGSAMGMGKLQAAEGTASITGTITDESGAVIPGASVTVSRAADHVSQTVISDSNGRYVVAGLAPGTYSVETRAPGFKIARGSAVTASASGESVENFKLSVGTATQTVTVASGSYAEKIPLQKRAQANGPATAAVAAAPSVAAAPPIFEIITEDGSRWTSADGVTWKRH